MRITQEELDALREICAIGAGHASTALSEMTDKKVSVSFPSLQAVKIEDIPSLAGMPARLAASIYLQISQKKKKGRYFGHFLLIFSYSDAIQFTDILRNKKTKVLEQLDKDALKETGNILSSACLTAMFKIFNISLVESLPDISVDMLQATIDSVVAELGYKTNDALVFSTKFMIEDKEIKANFMMFFDPSTYDVLVERIKEVQTDD